MPKITYYFDIISPYTAFSTFVLQRYQQLWKDLQVVYKPFFLGGVMHATKNKPPAMTIPQRANFLHGDLKRNSSLFEVPLLPLPSNFFQVARDVIKFQRVIVAAQLCGCSSGQVKSLIISCTNAIHMDDSLRNEDGELHLNMEKILHCISAAGFDKKMASRILETSKLNEVKSILKANTAEALDRGAYGSPSFWIEGAPKPFDKPFYVFGSDRFEQISHVLNLQWLGPVPKTVGAKLRSAL